MIDGYSGRGFSQVGGNLFILFYVKINEGGGWIQRFFKSNEELQRNGKKVL